MSIRDAYSDAPLSASTARVTSTLRVLVDFTGPLSGDTGGATYARYFIPNWIDQFDDNLIAMFSHGEVPETLREVTSVVECQPRGSTKSLARVLDRHTAVRREVARLRPDVVYFPGNFVAAGLPKGVPVVTAVRSLLHYHYPSQIATLFPPSKLRGVYRRTATRHAVRRADRIIVPSSATADDLMRLLGVPRRSIVVVPHGVDLELFRPDPQVKADPNRFLFVSKPWDYKGLATVLRAMPAVCHELSPAAVRLCVADGGTPDAELAQWRAFAARLGVAGRIEFLGRVRHEALALEYRRASALVLPASIESFGNPFLEAAASGCPVITGRGHGIDETIGGVATQVPAHRHADVAEAMIACAQMSPSRRQVDAAALRTWAERFPWDKSVSETRRVLCEVV